MHTYIQTDRQKSCSLAVFYHRSIPSFQRKTKIEIYSERPTYSSLLAALRPRWRNGEKTVDVLLESLWILWKAAGSELGSQ